MIVVLLIITFVVLIIGTITDIKTREVPDWLNYSFIAAALGIRLIYSVDGNWFILQSGIIGLGVTFLFASILYYSAQWGGGDSKLLMGMGAAIGITYPLTTESLQLFWFFILLLFLGACYGIIWMIVLAVKHWSEFSSLFKKELAENKKLHLGLGIAALILLIPAIWVLWLMILPLFMMGFFYLFLFVQIMEKRYFIKSVPVGNLTEGDWLVEEVLNNGKVILSKKTLEKTDLTLLKKQKVKTVVIKEGIPFVPSFLGAYIILVIFSYFGVNLASLLF